MANDESGMSGRLFGYSAGALFCVAGFKVVLPLSAFFGLIFIGIGFLILGSSFGRS